jgi:hypothetical protein
MPWRHGIDQGFGFVRSNVVHNIDYLAEYNYPHLLR